MKHPEITWSLMHPTPLDPDYVRQLIRKASAYEVDSLEICGECHSTYGGLDGLIDYREYPGASASWDQEKVMDNRMKLNGILAVSHAAGKKVCLWHREVMIPPGLLKDLPELLDENNEFDLLGETFASLIRYKLDRALAAVPELDGLVLTLTEADFSTIHNSNADRYPPVEVVRFIAEIFAAELAKRGKRFIMRSFGSIAEDYECILAGVSKLAGKYAFEVETKITPYDFVPFLPLNPFLRKIPGLTLSAECDCLGEFMGRGDMPAVQVHNIVRYVREGQTAGVDRFAIRMDRCGNRIFDLYELNYYAYDRAIHDPDATAETILREWQETHYPAECRAALAELDRIGWEAVCKTFFIDEHVLFHGSYCMKYLKAAFVFALFGEEGRTLADGRGVWSILTGKTAPGRAAILAEKDQAVLLADKGLALLKSLDLPADDFRHRLWRNAVVITRAVRELIRCIISYFDDMEQGNGDLPRLSAQVAASQNEFERLLAICDRDPAIKSDVIDPLTAICCELRNEFAAEYQARKKFLSGCVDGIIAGGLTDDWRIHRYMHASHAALHNGLPARRAGNSVFPNGFLEMELKRGTELVIAGAPDVTRNFTLLCDGKRMDCELDDDGIFTMPLPSSEKNVSIRLEKSGPVYPLFHAVFTRKAYVLCF